MQEITVILKAPGKPDQTETVFNHETAIGMKERWEKLGGGNTAVIVNASAASKVA